MEHYTYRFAPDVPSQEMEDTFMLALLAVESLYGHSRVRMESRFKVDKENRTCLIEAMTQIGSDLAKIFTGFSTKEYGERAVMIDRKNGEPFGSNVEEKMAEGVA
ncbi:MAG: hypothetical protein V3V05_07630 [Pontiella sp.]